MLFSSTNRDTTRLQSIIRITRAVSTVHDLHTLITLLASETSKVLNVERSTVFLYSRKTDELWSYVAEGEPNEIRFSADQGIAGSVFQTTETIILNNVSDDERFNKDIDDTTGFITRNMITSPIINPSGHCIGVFQVINKEGGNFRNDDAEFLQIVAAEAAVTIENVRLLESRKRMFDSLIKALVISIEARDPLTAGHSFDVTFLAGKIAEYLKLDSDTSEAIYYAALLHDYGKIAVPDSILKKPGTLSTEEFSILRKHVQHTRIILSPIEFEERLEQIPVFASQHHERIDGKGYPDGLKGDDISIGGKIIAVADVFEALTAKRHYREPFTLEKTLNILIEGIDTQFDRDAVLALRQYFIDIGKIEPEKVPLLEKTRDVL
ncbi:MAG: HD domain-containing protein [Candidatus Aegiribacteria sp.]|nr:HD domain-containing protein [Candidatus Aegiribacteria sp.]